MATTPILEDLDALAPILCMIKNSRVSLTHDRGIYHLEYRGADGRLYFGHGAAPTIALKAAERQEAIAHSGGVHVDA